MGLRRRWPWQLQHGQHPYSPWSEGTGSLNIKNEWCGVTENPTRAKSFPDSSAGKESAHNSRDSGSILGSGRSPVEGIGYPCQYSCLENHMDRGAWWATVHGVTKSGHDWTNVCKNLKTPFMALLEYVYRLAFPHSGLMWVCVCDQLFLLELPWPGKSSLHNCYNPPVSQSPLICHLSICFRAHIDTSEVGIIIPRSHSL